MRVRFVESPEKYNYSLSTGRMFYYRFPYLILNPFKGVCAMARIVQLPGNLRSNDTTATRTSLESEFAFFHSLSRFFLPTYFVKCRRTQLELNSYET